MIKMKRFCCSFMVLLFVLASALSVSASNEPQSILSASELQESIQQGIVAYKSYISKFFENPGKYILYDKYGNNISNSFFVDYYTLYENGDYRALKSITDKLGTYLVMQTNDFPKAYAVTTSKTYNKSAYLLLKYNIQSFEMLIGMDFSYKTDSSGIVSPMNAVPTLTIDPSEYFYSFYLTNHEISNYVANDKSYGRVTDRFDVYAVNSYGADDWYFGTVEISATVHSNGTQDSPTCKQVK